MYSDYLTWKKKYPNSVGLIKSGSFYRTYDNDAIILSYLCCYKVIKNGLGFPIRSLSKVLKKLKREEVNFKVISKYLGFELVFSKKHYYLKDLVEKELFSLLKEIYIVNELSQNRDTLEKKRSLVGRVKYLNFLFEMLVDFKIMSEKQYKVLHIELENIYYSLVGWIKYEGRSC